MEKVAFANMNGSLVIQTRFARPQILIGGTDYFPSLAPYFLSLSYTDSCDGEKSDSIDIELCERDGQFMGPSFPHKGTFFDVFINCYNWRFSGDNTALECGRFFIDDVHFKGPPRTMSIKANSVPTDSKVKSKQTTRAWENTTLDKVANQIAAENQMTVLWEGEESPRFKRLEQTESSDLAFLKQKARDAGLSIKVSKRQIIFFDEQKYEEKEPRFSLIYGFNVRSWSFSTKFTDTAKKAKCEYVNPETGRLTSEEFEDLEVESWAGELIINENPGFEEDEDFDEAFALAEVGPSPRTELIDYPVPNIKENSPRANRGKGSGGNRVARRKAKKHLRDKNKEKTKAGDKSNTFGIEIMGNPTIAAGQTCLVEGFGFYDGKYIVVSARHKVGPEYDTSLSIRKCLVGY